MIQPGTKILITGANGMLARMVTEQAPAGVEVVGVDLPDFDLTDEGQVKSKVSEVRPGVIINCAAYTDVDGCESNVDAAMCVNGSSVGYLAAAAEVIGATLVHISTDYVFSGVGNEPYTESDKPAPRSVYGKSKLAGERVILESDLDSYYIVRTSWLYGPGGKNFVETIIRLAGERDELRVVADQTGSPTYTSDLATGIYGLLNGRAEYGIYHYSNSGSCSWYDFAGEIVALSRKNKLPVKVETVSPIQTDAYPLPATRPAYSVFAKEKFIHATGIIPPDWRDALIRYFAARDGYSIREKTCQE